MFAKSIVLSDVFLDMPMSARCLYFTLGMLADDDGFVGNPKSIMRQCGATDDDLRILLAKRYVLGFDSGIIVIKHWRMNNFLRADRAKPTTYVEELKTLTIDEKGAYTEAEKVGIPSDNQMTTNCQSIGIPSIGKDSIGKNSIDKFSLGKYSLDNSDDDYKKRVQESIAIEKERYIECYHSSNIPNEAEELLIKNIKGLIKNIKAIPNNLITSWYLIAIDCLTDDRPEAIFNKDAYLCTSIRKDIANIKECTYVN